MMYRRQEQHATLESSALGLPYSAPEALLCRIAIPQPTQSSSDSLRDAAVPGVRSGFRRVVGSPGRLGKTGPQVVNVR